MRNNRLSIPMYSTIWQHDRQAAVCSFRVLQPLIDHRSISIRQHWLLSSTTILEFQHPVVQKFYLPFRWKSLPSVFPIQRYQRDGYLAV